MMTNAELAILSLIAEQPRHGYEIEQVVEERGMRDWSELGFSTIYYLLKKLETSGWIESRVEPTGGRGSARKVYSITQPGLAIMHQATLQALSEPQPCYLPIQLGLANLPAVSPVEALDALRLYRERLQERQVYVRSRWARGGGHFPVHVNAMFEMSLAMIAAELTWVTQFIETLETTSGPSAATRDESQKGESHDEN